METDDATRSAASSTTAIVDDGMVDASPTGDGGDREPGARARTNAETFELWVTERDGKALDAAGGWGRSPRALDAI